MEVIVITNENGGVAKTTTAVTLATMLNKRGYKTLLIDTNPTPNASIVYRAKLGNGIATLYDVLIAPEKRIPIEEAIQTPEKDGTIGDIVPGDRLMSAADATLYQDPDVIFHLKEALENLKNYDYVVLDTPQKYGVIVQSCLIAANKLIIPCLTDNFSEMGLSGMTHIVDAIRKRYNPQLTIDGILLVRVRNTRLRKFKEDQFRRIATEQIGTKVYKSSVRECNAVVEAQEFRQALVEYAPKSTAAVDYNNFLDELLGEEESYGKE